jgi:diguanylate cyclase (GGDEF)-like protein
MHPKPCHGVAGRVRAAPGWPVWEYPRWLVVFIALVVTTWLAGIGVAVSKWHLSGREALILGGLLVCTAASIELTRRSGENAGLASDIFAVWELPIAILLPAVYAMTVPVLRVALTQLRVRQMPLHRRVFSTAVLGLSYGSASLVFHAIGPRAGFTPGQPGLPWVLAVAGAAVVQWAVNWLLLLPAITGSNPGVQLREMVPARQVIENDVTELCVAVLVTLGIGVTPVVIVFALPFVTLLQRFSRHAHLVNASRIDSKTGLLNAGTWDREAAVEVARAVRTRSPLAVALLDIDHFKAVNDTYGHLTGDQALGAIGRSLTALLREYDLAGRFGGEEFALLMPQTSPVDAYRIAERIRDHLAAMPIDPGSTPDARPFNVTVSIGVATVSASWGANVRTQLTDLLAAADNALYHAKQGGRDQVCIITENIANNVTTPHNPAAQGNCTSLV